MINDDLVGGIPTPLKNMLVSWDDDIPNMWKNKKCSKPPTRNDIDTDIDMKVIPEKYGYRDIRRDRFTIVEGTQNKWNYRIFVDIHCYFWICMDTYLLVGNLLSTNI